MKLSSLKTLLKMVPGKYLNHYLVPWLQPKTLQLLTLLLHKDVQTDQEAYEAISKDNTVKKNSYLKLKERLEEKVFTLFLTRDFSKLRSSLYYRKLLEAYRKMLISRLLTFLGIIKPACEIGEKSLKIGQQFHLYDVVYFNSWTLCTRYSFLGDHKRFHHYAQINRDARNILNIENEAFLFFTEYNTLFTKKSYLKETEYQRLRQYLEECRMNLEKSFTHNLYLYYLRLGDFLNMVNRDYRQVIEEWEGFEEYLEKNPHLFVEGQYAEANLKKLEAALNLQWLQYGERFLNNCQKVLKPRETHWFIAQEYYVLLLIQEGAYKDALSHLKSVKNHKNFNRLPAYFPELWHIIHAYLQFIFEAGWTGIKEAPGFKIYKFLNETPIYTQDKAGRNTNILVIQILFHLLRQEWEPIIEKEETLRLYRYRYLKTKNYKRTHLFIKLLSLLPRKNFQYNKVKKASEEDFQVLKASKTYHAHGLGMVEIIPYETLWHWVLTRLKD